MWIVIYTKNISVEWGDPKVQVAEIATNQQEIISLLEANPGARVFEAKELKAKVKPVLVFE